MRKIPKESYFELAVFLMDYHGGQWSRGYRLLCRLDPSNFSSALCEELRERKSTSTRSKLFPEGMTMKLENIRVGMVLRLKREVLDSSVHCDVVSPSSHHGLLGIGDELAPSKGWTL